MRFYTTLFFLLTSVFSFADAEDSFKAPNILSYFPEKGHLIFEEPAGFKEYPRGLFPKIDFFAIEEVKRKFTYLPKVDLDKFNWVTETFIGFPDIIWGFGELYKNGHEDNGIIENVFLAGMYMQYSALLGNSVYQEKLAQEFLNGEVFERDSTVALTWAVKSAKQDYWKGMWTAADILLADESLNSNPKDAAFWLQKLIVIEPQTESQKLNISWAMLELGNLYLDGRGVEKNVQKGVDLITKSAEAHNIVAMYSLGYIYYFGKDVTENYATAAKWFLKSAEQGLSEAQKSLSYMFMHGQGVEKNLVKAFAWGLLANKKGQNVQDWDSLRSLMTQVQVNEAQDMALLLEKMEGWIQKKYLVDGLIVTKKTKIRDLNCVKGEVLKFDIKGNIGPDTTFVLQELFGEADTCVTSTGEEIPIKVSLSSPGGLLSDGYMLGDFFRERNVKTIIESGNVCGSSCAIAFLGGKERIIVDDGTLIFHAPYTIKFKESGKKIFKCIDNEKSLKALQDYFITMTTTENGKRLFDRTMKYCNPQDGWIIKGVNSAQLYGLSTFHD